MLLLSLALLVFAPLLAPGRAPYSPYSDVVAQHLATKQVAWDALRRAGQLPLWRDDQFAGTPALTNPQALYLHPLQLGFWLLPPEAAIGPSFVLSFWVAALGCYALARTLGASWLAGLLSGIAGLCAWKPMLAAQAGWLAPLASLALVPFSIAGLLRLAERPDRGRALALAALAAIASAGGSPQFLYYGALLAAPYLVLAQRAEPHGTRLRRSVRALALAGLAGALGVACNAYLWWAVLDDLSWLTRTSGPNDAQFFLSGHAIEPAQLWTLLHPGLAEAAREAWEEGAYFGWLPLALALVACLSSPRRSAARYCGGALIAGLLLALDTPLLDAARAWLPGYAQFRLPGRMLFVTSSLGIALAGVGLDRVLRALRERGRPRVALSAALAMMLVIAAEGASHARTLLSTAPIAELGPDPDHPARSIARRGSPAALSAVLGRGTLNYGWAAALGLRLANGYDPYNYAHYRRYLRLITVGEPRALQGNWADLPGEVRMDLLDELGVRFLISPKPMAATELELIAQADDARNFVLYAGMRRRPVYVYENHAARPYARFATEAVPVDSLELMERRLASERVRGQAYWLAAADRTPAPPPDPAARVRLRSHAPGRALIETSNRSRQLLVVAEVFHPGWRARIDGRPAPVERVNLALLGLWVDAGTRRVELTFAPPHFAASLWLSGGSLLLLLGAALAWLRARVRS